MHSKEANVYIIVVLDYNTGIYLNTISIFKNNIKTTRDKSTYQLQTRPAEKDCAPQDRNCFVSVCGA